MDRLTDDALAHIERWMETIREIAQAPSAAPDLADPLGVSELEQWIRASVAMATEAEAMPKR
jgi:hypothetical protein